MNTPFPFGFPLPTAFYLTVYIVTLVIHVVFMNYVLAGSAWLAISGIFLGAKGKPRTDSPISLILRDWMPFAVSAAITAGVAPLLFIQILYKENFYTANLLLFHRWMAIVPVLIVGFYLTYLFKSKTIAAWPAWSRVLVGLAMFGCFLFAALSWTENHLLALDRAIWPDLYASGSMIYKNYDIFPRLAMWAFGAFPTMATLVGWQLYAVSRKSNGKRLAGADSVQQSVGGDAIETSSGIEVGGKKNARAQAVGKSISPGAEKGPTLESFDPESPAVKTLALLAAIGLFIAGVFAGAYFHLLPISSRDVVVGPLSRVYLVVAGVGALAQFAAWHFIFHRRRLTARLLTLASVGVVLTLSGMTVARESLRIASVYIEGLYPQHAMAAEKGGFWVFLAFVVLNAILIAWCLKLANHGRSTPSPKP